jgi:L-2-amino-thiazoline-4-carboxylic acid hydrolase
MQMTPNPPATQHKFDQPVKQPLTHRECIELEYTSHFIPYLKVLEQTIGHDQVIKSLQEFAFPGVKQFAEQIVKATGKNDLSVIKEIYSPSNPNLSDVLTMEVLESTEETYVVNVTECLLAEVFRKAGAADYGYAALCLDILFTRLVNPQIGLDLEGTIMEGKPSCLHRWYVKP